jgi:putative ABC transport system permease protein
VSLRNLLWFYRRRFRARMIQELLALVGIAVGVSLLFAVQVSNRSLSASIAQLTDGLVGNAQLQLVARGPQGFDERLVREVERIDGVSAAAPMLQLPINAVGPRGERAATLLAADPSLARLGGELLSGYSAGRLATLRSIVLPTSIARALGVRFGEMLTLQVHGRTERVPVGATVGRSDVGLLADTPAVVAPLGYGQAIAGLEGRVSRVFVLAEADREHAVETALRRVAAGRVDVRPTDSDSRLFARAALPNDQSTALFAGICALVGFLFAFNAMLLMARERRGVIAELRMSGHGFWTVLQVLLFDALVLGLVASGVGLALGELLSRFVFHPSPGYLAIAFPVGSARVVDWQTIVLAVGCGTLAATLASLMPLTAAFRASAMDAVEEDEMRQGSRTPLRASRLVAGSALGLVVSTVILLVAPAAAILGMVTLIASLLLVLPVVLSSMLAFAARHHRRVPSVVPAIAIGELLSARSRSVAIAAIAAIAVFGSTAVEGAHRDLQRGLDPNAHELNSVADLWVSPAGDANTLATTPFSPNEALPRIARVPAVSDMRVYRGSFLDMRDRRVWVIAPPQVSSQPFPPSQVVEGDGALAAKRIRNGGWAVASEAVAEQEGLHVGKAFTLASPSPVRLRLAAITTNFGWSPGTLVLNAEDYRRAWDTTDASAIQVDLRPGVTPQAGRRLLKAALGPSSGLIVQTAAERERRDRATTREGLSRLTQIANLMLVAAALAMAAAMGGMIWQRRRRLADLKLAGINHRELWRALLLESALLLAIGCGIGAIFGLYGEQMLNRALNSVTGFPVDSSVGLVVALLSLAVVTSVACLVAMVPGYLAARVPLDAAFRD